MNAFRRVDGQLWCESVPLSALADHVGTPAYVYSAQQLRERARRLESALEGAAHLSCYSVKACSNLAVLSLLREEGLGFDIVSGGELYRVRRAGGRASRVVFSGVGKTPEEMAQALRAGVLLFNVESEQELLLLDAVAEAVGRPAPVALRVNPHVDPKTHPYVATGLRDAKFGIPWERAREAFALASRLPHLRVLGVDCHIGSQLTDLAPLAEAAGRVRELVQALAQDSLSLRYVDLGGGLGVPYDGERTPTVEAWARVLRRAVAGLGLTLLVEPGRWLVAEAGVLLTRVLLAKEGDSKRFVVTDAAMNDLVRPSLYDAYHALQPVGRPRRGREVVDVVGPVCESGDFLARGRSLPPLRGGDLLAVMTAGAYGFSMASTYNSRPRPCEVLVDGDRFRVVRERELLSDLVRGEQR